MTLALPARAKLNLDLEVLRRSADGYHEIRSTFQAIDLHDWLELDVAGSTQIEASGFAFATEESSIVKAQRALERAAKKPLNARIHVHKRIPPGSGMGGASTDAAATLVALSRLYRLEHVDLEAAALEVGADVPFFLRGGRALAEGRGERLTRLDDASSPNQWFAIAWPGVELSTAAVYGAWDSAGGEGPNHLRRAAAKVAPQLDEFAARLGAGWQMTGSGSAFFKGTRTEQEAREATADLECWTAVARTVGAW